MIGLSSKFIKRCSSDLNEIIALIPFAENKELSSFVEKTMRHILREENNYLIDIVHKFNEKTQILRLNSLYYSGTITLADVASVLSCASGLVFMIEDNSSHNRALLETITKEFISEYSFKQENLGVTDVMKELSSSIQDQEEFYINTVLQELVNTFNKNQSNVEIRNMINDLFIVLKAQFLRISYLGPTIFKSMLSKIRSAVISRFNALSSNLSKNILLEFSHHLNLLSESVINAKEQMTNGIKSSDDPSTKIEVIKSVEDFGEGIKSLSQQIIERLVGNSYGTMKLKFDSSYKLLDNLSSQIQKDIDNISVGNEETKRQYLFLIIKCLAPIINNAIQKYSNSLNEDQKQIIEKSLRNFIKTFTELIMRPISFMFEETYKFL